MEPPAKRRRLSGSSAPTTLETEDAQPSFRNVQLKFKSRLEDIFDKYGKDFTGIGDEVDLRTGEVVVDNGHLSRLREEVDVDGMLPDEDSDTDSDNEEDVLGLSDALEHIRALGLRFQAPANLEDDETEDFVGDEPVSPQNGEHQALRASDDGKAFYLSWRSISPILIQLDIRFPDADGQAAQQRPYPSHAPFFPYAQPTDPKWRTPQLPEKIFRRASISTTKVGGSITEAIPPRLSPEASIWQVQEAPQKESVEKKPWTREELGKLKHFRLNTDLSYKELSAYFPGRTSNDLRVRWHRMKKKEGLCMPTNIEKYAMLNNSAHNVLVYKFPEDRSQEQEKSRAVSQQELNYSNTSQPSLMYSNFTGVANDRLAQPVQPELLTNENNRKLSLRRYNRSERYDRLQNTSGIVTDRSSHTPSTTFPTRRKTSAGRGTMDAFSTPSLEQAAVSNQAADQPTMASGGVPVAPSTVENQLAPVPQNNSISYSPMEPNELAELAREKPFPLRGIFERQAMQAATPPAFEVHDKGTAARQSPNSSLATSGIKKMQRKQCEEGLLDNEASPLDSQDWGTADPIETSTAQIVSRKQKLRMAEKGMRRGSYMNRPKQHKTRRRSSDFDLDQHFHSPNIEVSRYSLETQDPADMIYSSDEKQNDPKAPPNQTARQEYAVQHSVTPSNETDKGQHNVRSTAHVTEGSCDDSLLETSNPVRPRGLPVHNTKRGPINDDVRVQVVIPIRRLIVEPAITPDEGASHEESAPEPDLPPVPEATLTRISHSVHQSNSSSTSVNDRIRSTSKTARLTKSEPKRQTEKKRKVERFLTPRKEVPSTSQPSSTSLFELLSDESEDELSLLSPTSLMKASTLQTKRKEALSSRCGKDGTPCRRSFCLRCVSPDSDLGC